MWVAEFKVWHQGSALLELTRLYDASISIYYLNSYEEDGREYMFKVCMVYGKEKEKLLRLAKNDERMQIIKVENDQIFYRVPSNYSFHHLLLDKTVFFLKPIYAKGGWEYWTLAAMDKAHLTRLYHNIRKVGLKAKIGMLSLKQMPLNFFTPALFTNLTALQKHAIDSAFKYGYYSYPREISVEELARKLKIPRSTLQEHLRKAEARVFSQVFSQIAGNI